MPPAPTSPFPLACSARGSAFLLAAVSGWMDTAGFLLLEGIFTAHVTGNFVLAGATLAGSGGELTWVRLGMFPVFMLAVAVWRWFPAPARVMLAVEGGLLALHGALGALVPFNAGGVTDPYLLALIAGTAVLAMGTQNTLMRVGLPSLPPTTMMTGNTTQFTLDLAAALFGRKPLPADVRPRLARFGGVLAGFFCGCALGALAAAYLGFAHVLLPVIILLALAAFPSRDTQPSATT